MPVWLYSGFRALRRRERFGPDAGNGLQKRIRIAALQQSKQIKKIFKAVQYSRRFIPKGEPAFYTFRFPGGAVIEYSRHAGPGSRQHIHVAITDIPGTPVCRQFKLLQYPEQNLRGWFVPGYVISAYGGIKQVLPTPFIYGCKLFSEKLTIAIGRHGQPDTHSLERRQILPGTWLKRLHLAEVAPVSFVVGFMCY